MRGREFLPASRVCAPNLVPWASACTIALGHTPETAQGSPFARSPVLPPCTADDRFREWREVRRVTAPSVGRFGLPVLPLSYWGGLGSPATVFTVAARELVAS